MPAKVIFNERTVLYGFTFFAGIEIEYASTPGFVNFTLYVTTQRNFYRGYRLLIYKASATGRCSRAYMDVFTRPYKSIICVLNSKYAE